MKKYFDDLKISQAPLLNKNTDQHKVYSTIIWSFDIESKDLDSHDFQNELSKNDIWRTNVKPLDLRSVYIRGTSQILEDFLINIETSKREEIIDNMYNSDRLIFDSNWKKSYDYYMKHASFFANIVCDKPGYRMGPHKDNAHIIATYIVNLTDNTDMFTTFYDVDAKSIIYKGFGQRNKGIGFLNTPASVHSIDNIYKPRYIFYMNILLPTL